MPLRKGKELETRYRALFDSEAIRDVVDARRPNDADPVDEEAILDFVQRSDKGHAGYVKEALRRLRNAQPI